MKAKELIAKLEKLAEEAEVYFDDAQGGLIDVSEVNIISSTKLKQCGRDSKFPGIVLSDSPPL